MLFGLSETAMLPPQSEPRLCMPSAPAPATACRA